MAHISVKRAKKSPPAGLIVPDRCVNDSAVWLLMLKKRNTSVHIYNEQEVDEMILLIRDSFIPAFVALEKTLREKLAEAESDWT